MPVGEAAKRCQENDGNCEAELMWLFGLVAFLPAKQVDEQTGKKFDADQSQLIAHSRGLIVSKG